MPVYRPGRLMAHGVRPARPVAPAITHFAAVAPEMVLIVLALAIMWGGSRLALRRPANWTAGSFPGGADVAWTVFLMLALTLVTGAIVWPLRLPSQGTPYVTVAVTAVLAVLFGWSAARSWRGRAAVAAVWAAGAGTWLFSADWLTYTVAAGATAIMFFALIRPGLSFWETSALLALCSGWDAYNLSVTHAAAVAAAAAADPFAGGAVLRGHVAGIPEMIGIPGHITALSLYAAGLGIADVTLPGLLVVAAGRAGTLAGAPRLYRAAMLGYAGGLAAVTVVARLTGAAMPVLPFVTPAIVLAVAVTAWRAGAWRYLSVQQMPARAADPKQGTAW